MLPTVRSARSAITKQLSECADHGQACAQCYNVAVGRVCLPWSGVRAVLKRSSRTSVLPMVRHARSSITKQSVRAALKRSSRAGALTMVRRARSAKTKQSGGCAHRSPACEQC